MIRGKRFGYLHYLMEIAPASGATALGSAQVPLWTWDSGLGIILWS